MRIKVGVRPSKLALKQVEEIGTHFPELVFEVISIQTEGDIDKKTPLARVENSSFFTHEIEEALLKGEIDVAIHSAKDLEESPPGELVIAALTKSVSSSDCLVSKEGFTLEGLPKGAIVGTSSRARTDGIKKYRADLVVKDIRGTIDERIAQMHNGDYNAIIMAQVALMRLGYWDVPARVISRSVFEPHPLQGRLAIQVHKDRQDLINIFGKINEE